MYQLWFIKSVSLCVMKLIKTRRRLEDFEKERTRKPCIIFFWIVTMFVRRIAQYFSDLGEGSTDHTNPMTPEVQPDCKALPYWHGARGLASGRFFVIRIRRQ